MVQPGDRLIWVAKCTESDSLLLANSEGKAIRFCADDTQVTLDHYKATPELGLMLKSAVIATVRSAQTLFHHLDVLQSLACKPGH